MAKAIQAGKEVFISHSTKDKALIDEFVKFVILGLDVDRKNIYCVSYNPDEIPSGEVFTEHIKKNINAAEVIFLIITPNFLESKFCLAEMGAAWALGKKMIPIIVEPLKFSALGDTPLVATQAFQLSSLEAVADEIKKIDGFDDFSIALFNEHARSFESKLRGILKKLPVPNYVSVKEHEQAEREIKTLIDKNNKQRQELEVCQQYVEQLESIKDAAQVQELKTARMDNWEQLENIIEDAKDKLHPFSDLLVTILYYDVRGEEFRPNGENVHGIWNDIETMKNDDRVFVNDDDYTVTANTEYPDIEEAESILRQLKDFVSWASSSEPDLVKSFKLKYRMPLSFNANLFRTLLKKNIYASN